MELHSDPITLNVLPLPEEGKPAGFSGAVGRFTLAGVGGSHRGDGGRSDHAADDVERQRQPRRSRAAAVGEYRRVPHVRDAPRQVRRWRRRAAPPSPSPSSRCSFRTTRTSARCRPCDFSYFDPQTHRYETARTDPIALVVRPPQNAARQEVFAAGTPGQRVAPEEKLGHDIVYIKDDPGATVGALRPLVRQPVLLAVAAGAAAAVRRGRLVRPPPPALERRRALRALQPRRETGAPGSRRRREGVGQG